MIADGSTAVPKGTAARFPSTRTRSRPHEERQWIHGGVSRVRNGAHGRHRHQQQHQQQQGVALNPTPSNFTRLRLPGGTDSCTTPSRREVAFLSVTVVELSPGDQSPRSRSQAALRGKERTGTRSKWGGGLTCPSAAVHQPKRSSRAFAWNPQRAAPDPTARLEV
jgi:hypothetical protein